MMERAHGKFELVKWRRHQVDTSSAPVPAAGVLFFFGLDIASANIYSGCDIGTLSGVLHMASEKSGCGCLLIILIIVGFIVGVYLYGKGIIKDPRDIPHP